MWFTETPWPPVGILLFVSLILFGIGWQTQRTSWMAGVGLCLAAAWGVWLVEGWIVTPSEVVESRVTKLVAAFQKNDEAATVRHLSAGLDAIPLVLLAKLAVATVDLDEGYRLTDMQITLHSNDTAATSHFRVNGNIRMATQGNLGPKPFRFMGYWRLEKGEWKLHKIDDLDPITGEVLNRYELL